VIDMLVQMGKTSYLVSVLQGSPERNLRQKFLEDFGREPDPNIRGWIKNLALHESDPDLRALALSTLHEAVGSGER
ncbi:MAG: hypothetical protein LAO07_16295, partial [Acidobacteriia bacterium]|nr:hypothetical protein [Terriglobia bacterium]